MVLGPVLTPDGLQIQLSAMEVIMAMWQSDGELTMNDEGQRAFEALVEYLALPVNTLGGENSLKVKASLPQQLRLGLMVDPFAGSAEPVAGSRGKKLTLDVALALRKTSAEQREKDALRPQLALQPPTWLTSAQHNKLVEACGLHAEAPSAEDEDIVTYIMDLIEKTSEECALLPLDQVGNDAKIEPRSTPQLLTTTKRVYRSWSMLPSLNTREKRGELVDYAALHNPPLTGFVIAGKPALVVLEYPLADDSTAEAKEGELEKARHDILGYWSEIKRLSWSDIQASHKKVTEMLVEPDVTRAFTSMDDVTGKDEVGGQEALRGTYKHRNDWRLVEAWLLQKGAGGRLREALGADWTA